MTATIGLHDAELISLGLDRIQKCVVLRFVLPNGLQRAIQLNNVSHFRATDVISQNVVSDVLISSERSFSPDDILHWLKWITKLTDTGTFATDDQLRMIQAQVLRRERILFVSEPSWGAEIAAISETYMIFDIPDESQQQSVAVRIP